MTGFAVTLVIGVTLIFVGFLVSATARSGAEPSPTRSAAVR
jgi:hypothetical protein